MKSKLFAQCFFGFINAVKPQKAKTTDIVEIPQKYPLRFSFDNLIERIERLLSV